MNAPENTRRNLLDRVLFLTCTDPWDNPTSGQATFARHLLKVFADRLFVVGMSSSQTKAGSIEYRDLNGTSVPFLSLGNIRSTRSKRILPRRLVVYLLVRHGMKWIRETGISCAFMQTPEFVFATCKEDWTSTCYRSAGVENPVLHSRYKHLRFLGSQYERTLFKSLKRLHPAVILASASLKKIEDMKSRSEGMLNNIQIVQFTTRVDTDVFHPIDRASCRVALEIASNSTVFCTCGRISWIKGWKFLLEGFRIYSSRNPGSLMVFVGSGEDVPEFREQVARLNIEGQVILTGFIAQARVAQYINAADACLVGSYKEGWSLAMLEMIACGKAVVSTDVCGAKEMILTGGNGYILDSRDAEELASAMSEVLRLPDSSSISLAVAEKYSVQSMRSELETLWPPIASRTN